MKKWVIIFGAIGVIFLMAGCAGKKESAAAGTQALQVKVIKVATGNNYRPFCYLNEKKELVGYDVAVLKEVNRRLPQYEFQFDTAQISAILLGVESGKYDMGSHQLSKDPEREKKFLFSDEPMGRREFKVVVRKERNDINSMDDLAGKKYSIPTTSAHLKLLRAYNEQNPNKKIDLMPVEDLSTADQLKLVEVGRSDATQMQELVFNEVQKQLNLNLKLTFTVFDGSLYFVFNKNQAELKTQVDHALKEMREDGTLAKISQETLGIDVFKK